VSRVHLRPVPFFLGFGIDDEGGWDLLSILLISLFREKHNVGF
jgi:hypothetical protein